MVLLITVFALLLLVLGWLLMAPIVLKIDTQEELCYLKWKGIAGVRLLVLADELVLKIQVFFWKKNIYPLSYSPNTSNTKQAAQPKKKKKPRMPWRKGKKLLQSFTVQTFQLDLDTDDFVQNSYLFPIFYFLSSERRQLRINYSGQMRLKLEVQNRLYHLLKAWLF